MIIDILLGSDHYFKYITGFREEIKPGLFEIGSNFGKILKGRLGENFQYEHISLLQLCAYTSLSSDSELEQFRSLENFWKLPQKLHCNRPTR